MPAYLVAEIEITDPETYARYRARTPDAIAAHGGPAHGGPESVSFSLVRGGAVEVKEGMPPAGRVVIVEFPDMAAARRFYDSPDYRAILPLRLAASRGRLYLVEGV